MTRGGDWPWGDSQHQAWTDSQHQPWADTQNQAWTDSQHQHWSDTQHQPWGDTRHQAWTDSQQRQWSDSQNQPWADSQQQHWADTQRELWGAVQQQPWGDTRQSTLNGGWYDESPPPADDWGAATTYGSRQQPPSRPSSRHRGPRRRRRGRGGLIAVAVVALVAAIAGVTAVRLSSRHHDHPAAGSSAASRGAGGAPVSSPAHKATPVGAPVHVSLFQGDGQTYGIGMPIIAQFSRKVTDARAFNQAVRVTVNGQRADGAWFWVNSNAGYAMEAHYRLSHYWPAHAEIELSMPVKGLSAGPGLSFDDSLSLKISTGAAHIVMVDGSTEQMTVTSDGRAVKQFPVSLGKAATPTYLGTKLVMAKKNPQLMVSAPGEANPYRLQVPWSVRLTNSGEFIHAAAWNTGNIGSRSTSHGCTNLTVADAKWFYSFAQVGDVVTYTNTGASTTMPSWDGLGDWNVPWSDWTAGNLLKN
jgi:lipoprotein-anchoring transpeptidase ErfK/SrfK